MNIILEASLLLVCAAYYSFLPAALFLQILFFPFNYKVTFAFSTL